MKTSDSPSLIKDIRKASLISTCIGIVLFFALGFFSDKFAFILFDRLIVPLIGLALVFPISLLILLLTNLPGELKPLTDSGFWVKRAFLDLELVGGLFIFLTAIPFFFFSVNNLADYLSPNSAQVVFADPSVFFWGEILVVFALVGLLGFRKLIGTLPLGVVLFSVKKVWQDLGIVVLGSITLLTLGIIYPIALQSLGISVPEQFIIPKEALVSYGPIFLILTIGILAPIFEEIFFRGYMLPLLATKNRLFALVVTSAIWSAIHFNLQLFPLIFAIGMLLGYTYLKRQNLWITILIHIVNNLAAVIMMIYFTK